MRFEARLLGSFPNQIERRRVCVLRSDGLPTRHLDVFECDVSALFGRERAAHRRCITVLRPKNKFLRREIAFACKTFCEDVAQTKRVKCFCFAVVGIEAGDGFGADRFREVRERHRAHGLSVVNECERGVGIALRLAGKEGDEPEAPHSECAFFGAIITANGRKSA